jgi:regulator of sigma E protease
MVRRAVGANPLDVVVLRDGQRIKTTVAQALRDERDEAGVKVKVPELGAEPDDSIFATKVATVTVKYDPAEAVVRGVAGTWEVTRGMALGIIKIFTGHISTEAIGGPIMIADVARKAADAGILPFLSVMAMISISLGLMNLIPIPVLDGFHILSAAIEGVRRKPLSLRFREIANVVGVALVLTLMLYALKNDAVKKFFE